MHLTFIYIQVNLIVYTYLNIHTYFNLRPKGYLVDLVVEKKCKKLSIYSPPVAFASSPLQCLFSWFSSVPCPCLS